MTDYRIDDLARSAGTTVRNVRVYQDRGLLPPPRREGRVAWYSELHLIRLRLVGRLLERGFTFAHIAELTDAWEAGRDLGEVFGLEEVLTRPWSDEEPSRMGVVELRRLFGREGTKKNVDRALALGLIRREGIQILVPSPRLLHSGLEMVRAGIPLSTVLDVAEVLQRELDSIAGEIIRLVREQVVPGGGPVPDDLDEFDFGAATEKLLRLRPLAMRTVDALLAQAMERETNRYFGEAASRLILRRSQGGSNDAASDHHGGSVASA